jgi:hypothetical protein
MLPGEQMPPAESAVETELAAVGAPQELPPPDQLGLF